MMTFDKERKMEQIDGLEPGCCYISDPNTPLGEGAFGNVYGGLYKDEDGHVHDVAIKLTEKLGLEDARALTGKELSLYDRLSNAHPNVVRCFGGNTLLEPWNLEIMKQIVLPDKQDYIVLELLPQNLYDLMYGENDFEENHKYRRVIEIFKDIAEGLRYLEARNIVHFDLKPWNVLIDDQGRAKIADFSESKIRMQYTITPTHRGTTGFIAPELLWPSTPGQPVKPTNSVDVYSFGVMLAFCLKRQNPTNVEFGEEPSDIWTLVRDCCRHDLIDEGGHYLRPTRAQLVDRLAGMLCRRWVDDPIPWDPPAQP